MLNRLSNFQTITHFYETTTTRSTSDYEQSKPSRPELAPPEAAKPVQRKKVIRKKVDSSKFMTPYIAHSQKMQDLFSTNKYKENYENAKGQPYAITTDTPELRRIKKVQDQLSEVKYRVDGDVAKTICHVDEKAKDIEHAKKVSQQVSKVLYKQNWEDTKDKYLLPPDAPELVQAVKNTAMFSKKLYTEDWEADKSLFYPYNDSPELRRVAQAQKALSDIAYKKGHAEQRTQFTSLPDPPDIEFAKKVTNQVSKQKYKEDYENKVKGKWSETPCFEVATARMNAENISTRKYQEDFEHMKDQIYFMQTETPEYKVNKQAGLAASKVKYKEDYEKNKGKADYNVLPATENPLLRQLKAAGDALSDKLYKENYEKTKAKSMNYCETPKYQLDTLLKNFSEAKYKDSYVQNVLGHYIGSFEDPYQIHCMKVSAQNSDVSLKTIVHKFKCNIPADAPQFIQHRVNAYNLSDNVYKHDWEKSKAKKFDIKVDAIPLLAAKANTRNFSDVMYKKDYEKSKGKMIGALSINDDPKMLNCLKAAKNQSEHEYRKDYEKGKTIYTAPLDMLQVTQAKKSQAIASDVDYKHLLHNYSYPPDSINVDLAKKAYALQSDVEYKADYNSWMKGCGWVPFGSLEMEKAKRASDILNEKKYRQHPDTLKFTSIEDAPIIVQSKINQAQRSDVAYKAKGEEILHKYNLPADVPQFLQARLNAYNISEVYLKDLSKKGYDLRTDAIPIRVAKAARQAASDVQYKKDYEKAKGKMVGFQSLQDDPKLVHYMNVAKIQSDREYKKDYEKTKTKYNTPHDMFNVVAAKKAQDVASNVNYKHSLHHYTYLPDAMDLELSKNMMHIQSDNAYKEDYNNWMKGIGWIPIGSLEVEKVKKAGDALNEKKYRQHPDTLKFTSIVDSPVMVQAKQNTKQISDVLYKAKGEDVKHKYTVSPDLPQFLQAKCNAYNISDVSRDLANQILSLQYKYKEAHEKSKGKHVGFRSLQDDPKLVHYMNVAKLQSDREYKKNYENTKTSYHTPKDMVSITAAKMAQDVATNVNYKQPIHHYTYLPDAMSLEHTRNMNQIQSDNVYKDEYNSFFKGIGWIPLGSLEVETAKKAGDALNERKYRQHPDTIKFTSVPDSMGMVLAQQNTKQLSDLNYKVEGEKRKHKYTMDPELPQFIQAKVNALNMSDAHYKADWKKTIAKGYDLRPDAIPIVAAKSSRNIASDFKYKEAYEKAKGKQIGFLSLQDDPKLVHYMNVAKMQSDREYKKGYEVSKTRYHTPLDMFSVTAAKKSQEVATNTNYRQPFHSYTLLPDALNVEHSKNAMQIQSDNLYKSDFTNWMKGMGWIPIQSLEVETAKKAGEILSEKKYRQHPEKLKFTYAMDTMEQALNKSNKRTMDKVSTSCWPQPVNPLVLMPSSLKLYKAGWEEEKKKGYDLRPDAISIKAARASRDIASDYKYKQAYEQAKGKHIGFRSLEDDPKLVHFMQVAKMQSDREYKKGYEKSKTSFHTPVDMLSVVAAKKSQEVATNANYRNVIHTYNMLPDAMSLELAKNMMQIQSDNQYKADYADFMKGMGWLPLGSLEAEKNKKIISEKKYRQHPDTLKYSTLMDSMNMVLAQKNAKIMNEHLYKQAWEADKTKVHIMPDIPQIILAKANAINMSDKHYKLSLEESKKKGYDLRTDAIPIKAAKASRDIASDYKYKHNYEKERGKMVGFRSLEDDPKLVHSMQVAKMQSDLEYKKNYEKTKTSYHTPADMLSVTAAKDAQANVTNTNYKHLIHKYVLLPDAMSIELSKNMNRLQSDNEYKQDYNEWYKGLGWSPAGSLEVEKAKKATEYASDKKYRQHPSNFEFKKLPDSMDMVLAKQNAHTMNKHLYTIDWNKDKTKIHVMPDTPDILQAKQNQIAYSQVKLHKTLFKYKQGYRKQLGHHVGFRSLQDDPKLVLSMNVAKMQSEREYKKDFEKWKTRYTSPVDMLGVVLAKKCQALVSDVDYKNYLHHWTCLPDQNDVIQAKKAYDLQSENLYKSDLEWLKGIGWSPLGSLEAEKNKRASEIISEKKYRQPPDKNKFTSIPDAMDVVLAKTNRLYREAWDKDKTQVHIMPDTPDIIQAKANLMNTSDKLYRMGYEELKKKGYDLPLDAIPIKAAKASREIASEYKYKEGFRKQLGHHIGARDIKDDPKMMWSMHVAKIQSDREYKKDFEKWKTKFSSPVDMLGVVLAKKCQTLVSDVDYKNYLHQWTCLPDQSDVVHARHAYDLQSDNLYKSDLHWLKGIGWLPSGSLEDEKNKRATQILSDHNYRQHPDKFKFSSLMDSIPMVLAKNNAITMNHRLYTEAWDKDKTTVHIMPDTPEVLLAKQNKINFSEKLYKLGLEETKNRGYDMRLDAIPIRVAKASRDTASDFKYKEGYRKQLGHHIGARDIKDDPKMMWSMHVAKIQSDREYKKDFEKWKTKFSSPVDMLGVVLAKKCQTLVSDVDYKNYLHQWTCLPDQSDVIHARQAYDLQSDNMYKSDLQWLRGIGWVPIGSLDVEKCKRATEILSDKIYRQPPDRFKFTSVTDSLEQVLAKNNAITMNKRLYTEAWDKDKTQVHIMPDTPEIMLARMNKINYSESLYKLANEEAKKKGYDLRSDAIPIVAAKASRDIVSDYKYKDGYRKQLGHHIGARDIKDDPKMMWSMHVAKIQSDREYKKDFEKWKTKFSSPVDMLGVVLAKKCQTLVSDVDYKNYLHQWTCLPDQSDVIHARQAYDLQSDNIYKSDLQWLKGIGWVPIGSLDVVKCKRAGEILSDNLYRQPPDKLKFTSVTDSLEQVLAKNNAINMNKRLYTEAWDKDKTQVHIMPDTPEIMLARQNKINYSESLYKLANEEAKKKGYDLRSDAIPIVAAKASRDIVSDYKYKDGYRKQLGHHIGARDIKDDPKMMWSMHVAKIQSDREYKKDFEKWKTKFSSPVDMLGVVLAKKCQTLVSDVDYKNYLHQWTCLPDQNDVVHARQAYDLQSDNVYKSDLQWLKGIGWVPIGSLDVVKCKRAGEILSDNLYRQPPDKLKFTSVTDSLEQVLAKNNAINMNKRLYTEAWDKDKTQIHIMPDTPEITLARQNKINYSENLYRQAMEEAKKEGYDLRSDAIPIVAAKASRDIASDYKYKEAYRKQLGHHIGARAIHDDPKMMWSLHIAKVQSDREYKKDFEKYKTRFSSPVDMLGIVLAKKCQTLVSDVDYKHPLHEWTCLPDQNDVIQARKAYDLQSDNLYKSDLEWLKGIGWVPIGSVEVVKAKRATEILSDNIYRQRPDTLKFTSITDSPEQVLAKNNAINMNKRLYTEAWDKDKKTIHVMPDTPEIMLAKLNQINYSDKLYKLALEESKKEGYDLRLDAIPIQAAKASRDIASDYKYKEGYRKQIGHHIGARNIKDDPKMMWSMHVAKIQSDREYKKDFEKWKTKFSSPVDMLGVVLAKKCQILVSDIDYKHPLHEWTCLPDQNDVIHARKAYDLQSDAIYKADLEWLRGIGWVPIGSVEVEKVKRAGEILSERKYRQPADQLKFTSITDTPEIVLAKNNALTMSKHLYTEAWDADKTSIHVMPDTPEILLAKSNSANVSQKLYTKGWDESKMKDYDLRADAIPIKSAKASRDIASDYKYKEAYEKQKGHHIGARSVEDDPKIMCAIHAGKIQSDREYKKDFQKWKTKFSSPVDMLDIVQAKKCQTLVSDVDYRNYLHHWICLPDQNDVIQARKAYELQSDNVYKADLEWLRGIGWMPEGSVEMTRVKGAQDLLNERLYRTRPEALKFTSIVDTPEVRLYQEAWNKDKTNVSIPSDTPIMLQAQINALQISNVRGINMKCKCPYGTRSVSLWSYKYKEGYRKQLGHHVGFRSLQDDPKLVWSIHAAKIQSEREYKKAYEKSKGIHNTPLDMMSIVQAKKCQTLVSDLDYRNYLHQWTCLPDQNDVIQAKKAYELQSDNVYKADLEWLKGIGWLPEGSVEVMRVKNAQNLLNERLYRIRPEALKFTSIVDTPEVILAKTNALQISEPLYRDAWDKEKANVNVPADTPLMLQSKINAMQISNYLYKTTYEKQKGHYIGLPSAKEDPKLVWAAKVMKMQNDRLYKKVYNDHKAKISIPVDMVSITAAKEGQELASNVDYRQYLHHWSCFPDQNDVIQARKKAYELQSDNVYKDDLNWLRGIGCYVWDTPQILHAKKAYDLQSQIQYTAAGKENLQNYNLVTDTPLYVTALQSGINASEVKYKENYHQIKDKYTTILETVDYDRIKNLKDLYSSNLYKEAWDKVKATSYILPSSTLSLTHAKNQKHLASIVKYREEYEKFKALYTLPKSVDDDPNTARCLRVGKFNIDRLYRSVYEKNKMKIHIVPDMVEMVTAKDSQKKVSEIDYRLHLHEWICHPDLKVNSHVRKVTDQISDIVYKDDLNWLKGIGCYVWDTPEILHAKHAYDLRNDVSLPCFSFFLSMFPSLCSLESRGEYRHCHRLVKCNAALCLPISDLILTLLSQFKYKEVYEHIKAHGYTLGPNDVPFVNVRRVNNVTSERLYRQLYHKLKDKIHTTPDTPEIRQVKKTQEAVSELIYKSDFFKMQGHMISMPYTPQVIHCRYVGDITSDIKYKEDLRILRGLGCFLYDTPDMVRSRHLRKLWVSIRDKYKVVLDTPEYRKVQELKTHLSEVRMLNLSLQGPHSSSDPFSGNHTRQKISPLPFVKVATMSKQTKYKIQYEKMKDRYTPVPDTPILIRAKRAYWNASDLRYKETFQKTKGKYHTVKDALDIVYHRKVTDDISKVKYKKNYMSQLGIWRSIADRPEHFHHRAVTDAISDIKYKSDLTWLKGIGCYAYDTPDFTLAEKNKTLYSKVYLLKDGDHIHSTYSSVHRGNSFSYFHPSPSTDYEQRKDKYHLVVDEPRHLLAKITGDQISQRKYKSSAKMLLKQGCNEILRPDMLTALYNTYMWSQIRYRKNYEKTKDKFTSIVDTPEHLRTTKVNKQISDILYKLEYNKARPRGYTTIHDTPMLLHVRKVKDEVSDVRAPLCHACDYEFRLLNDLFSSCSKQLDYKKQYEANKAHWRWIPDRPDFIQAAKSSLQQSDFEYKLDREFLRGCKLSVTDDKDMVLALRNSLIESDLKYKEKHVKERGSCHAVPDTPQILLAKTVSNLVSENKYKAYVKKRLAQGSYTTLPETRDTVHVKEVTKNVSDTNYKKKFVKERGKSNYSIMLEPPDVKHAMEVAKKQSDVAYRKSAKENLHYTTVADRPDIKKATQAAKQASEVEYRAKHRKEGSHGLSMLGRPDIEMAKKAAKLSSQGHGAASYDTPMMRHLKKINALLSDVQYRENFNKEKGKTPKYNPKESQLYKVMKDANNLASEVKYKADLKKLHKPVTDMKESLIMHHVLNTSQLASSYQYKKNYEKSKGHYHTIPDNLEQLHLKEATELQSIVKYKEKYEKERGKPMLDFETPTYITAKESQQMQSGKEYRKEYDESIKGRNLTGLEVTPALLHVKYATKIASEKEYRRDLEESIRGKGLSEMEDTPDMLRAKNATQILNEKEYKRDLELEVKGRGLNAMANETPDFMRARNATDIASQIKYKQLAEMEKANFTSVVDTPEIIHAQQVKNLSSKKKYKEDAEKCMSYYETVLDTPEMQRVRENQKNFSLLQYQCDLKNSKGKITVVQDTPEILRVKENQKNFSSVLYKENMGKGTPLPVTPEMERVKHNQENISSVLYSDSFRKQIQGKAAYVLDTPEMRRVRETQRHISTVKYHEDFEKHKGCFTPVVTDPITERVKKNTQDFSDINYRGIQRKVVEMEQKRNDQDQETVTGLRVWRTNPGSVFDYDPAEDNIQSRSLHMINVQAQRRSREQSRSASALSISGGEEKSEHSEAADHRLSTYSDGGIFSATSAAYKHAKTVELQQRSSSVATQQTTVSSIPSHPSTAGKIFRAMYDYMAADADEVSFKDGDAIVNVQAIDEGWMYGTVQRTGRTGMLPANYVEAI
uniref:Nebulin n=1 Tax=Equus asinus asinus TaxID=83772 RepID=A0A8C4N0J8_EQUAS